MKRTGFSRAEKRLVIGGGLAVVLLGGLGFALTNNGNSSAIPPRAPMPQPNGFDLYVAAAKTMTRPNPPVDENSDRKKRTPQEAAKFYTPARRAAFVAANAKAWNLMIQARAAQTLHPNARGNLLFKGPYQPLRDLARAKGVKVKHFLDLNRPDLALQSGLDILEMGRDIEPGGGILGSLVGIAVEAVGSASIETVPVALDAASARNGARRLERIIRGGISPAEVLTEEKWSLLTLAQNNYGQPKNRMLTIATFRTPATIRARMDDYIAQSQKPWPLQTYAPPANSFLNLFADLASSPKRYVFNATRRGAMESSLLLRLALRAYRVENGVYPDNLTQLAPKYLSKIPRDAFGRGEAMRYRKNGDSYLA